MSIFLAKFTLKYFIMIRLKELREEYSLNQTQLAKQLGFAQRTISNWENGIAEPNIQTLITISNYFHVTVDYLIGKDLSVLTEEKNIEKLQTDEAELLDYYRRSGQNKQDIKNIAKGYATLNDLNNSVKKSNRA